MNFRDASVLIIGHTVPEPQTTAAGVRMMALISFFKSRHAVIHFATAAANSDYAVDLSQQGIHCHQLILNDDHVTSLLDQCRPNIVVFDRFMTEEQYGWRVRAHSPNTVTILDTEDLHGLRKARQFAHEHTLPLDVYSDVTKRELASIWRCDVSLIISKFEYTWLQETFGVPQTLLFYWPLVFDMANQDAHDQEQTQDFICIGNLNHAPNLDAMSWLISDIWPKIEAHLPGVKLHIYGAYGRDMQQRQWQKTKGVLVHGWAPDIVPAMIQARVNLAPLRFGAGLKGKILQALQLGLPTVTTLIGAEGIAQEGTKALLIAENEIDLVQKAVALYTDAPMWKAQQDQGKYLITNSFSSAYFNAAFVLFLEPIMQDLSIHRQRHFMGQVLQHQSLYASKYLGRWLTLKTEFGA
jgi:O-antigen biosynthesis protein